MFQAREIECQKCRVFPVTVMRPRDFKECAPVYSEECETQYEQHCKVRTGGDQGDDVMMSGQQAVCDDIPDPVSRQQCLHPDLSAGGSRDIIVTICLWRLMYDVSVPRSRPRPATPRLCVIRRLTPSATRPGRRSALRFGTNLS